MDSLKTEDTSGTVVVIGIYDVDLVTEAVSDAKQNSSFIGSEQSI